MRSNTAATATDDASTGTASTFSLSAKLADLKSTHALGAEITEMGAKIYDLLRQEQDLRDARSKALRMLDQAAEKNVYRKLSEADLTKPLKLKNVCVVVDWWCTRTESEVRANFKHTKLQVPWRYMYVGLWLRSHA